MKIHYFGRGGIRCFNKKKNLEISDNTFFIFFGKLHFLKKKKLIKFHLKEMSAIITKDKLLISSKHRESRVPLITFEK